MTEITLIFNDQEYRVSGDRSWGLIEAVEDVISLFELFPALQSNKPPLAKVARAYAAALNYAGATGVTQHDIRAGVDLTQMLSMANQLAAILMLAFPEGEIAKASEQAGAETSEEPKKKAK